MTPHLLAWSLTRNSEEGGHRRNYQSIPVWTIKTRNVLTLFASLCTCPAVTETADPEGPCRQRALLGIYERKRGSVHTSTNGVISSGRRRRRTHSELFQAEAVGAFQQEGITIAEVVLARGVDASLLRRWLAEAGANRAPIAIQRAVPVMGTESPEGLHSSASVRQPHRGPDRVEVGRFYFGEGDQDDFGANS
jgi:transposase-like protein